MVEPDDDDPLAVWRAMAIGCLIGAVIIAVVIVAIKYL